MSRARSTVGPAPNRCPEGTRAPSMMHRLWVQLLQAVLGRVDMDPDTAPTELGFSLLSFFLSFVPSLFYHYISSSSSSSSSFLFCCWEEWRRERGRREEGGGGGGMELFILSLFLLIYLVFSFLLPPPLSSTHHPTDPLISSFRARFLPADD